MKLVHLSDLHLGYRQYQRQTSTGINQREADVAASFQRAIDKVVELRPDLILLGGDIFHTVRPTNPAILHAFTQFARLVNALPDAMVVMIAGNHDTARTAETGCILNLFKPLGIHVVESNAQRIISADGRLAILAVPDMPMGIPALVPEPSAEFNVLLLHGEVEGILPAHLRYSERAAVEIPRSEVADKGWNYAALGHYHVYQQVGPNAYYSGSIDYTSFDVWGEIREERMSGIYKEGEGGKGIIEHDLVTGKHTFHHCPVSREFVDLPPLDADKMSSQDIDLAIRERVERLPAGIENKVVRLIVRNVPRHIVRELDHKAIREYKRTALHFNLDTRKPELKPRSSGGGVPVRRPSLTDIVKDKLNSRVLVEPIDREKFVDLGLGYLKKTNAMSAPRSALEVDEG